MLEAAGRLLGSFHHTSAVIEFISPGNKLFAQLLKLLVSILSFLRVSGAEEINWHVSKVAVVIRALLMIIVPCLFQTCLVKVSAHDAVTFLQLFDPLWWLLVTGCLLGEGVGRNVLSPSFDGTINFLEVLSRYLDLPFVQKLSIFGTIPVLGRRSITFYLG